MLIEPFLQLKKPKMEPEMEEVQLQMGAEDTDGEVQFLYEEKKKDQGKMITAIVLDGPEEEEKGIGNDVGVSDELTPLAALY
jgi:hypothetical protein